MGTETKSSIILKFGLKIKNWKWVKKLKNEVKKQFYLYGIIPCPLKKYPCGYGIFWKAMIVQSRAYCYIEPKTYGTDRIDLVT
jgi:hypothetical protein